MTAARLIVECYAAGIEIFLADGAVKVRGPQDAVRRMMPVLRRRKIELQLHLQLSETDRARLLRQLEPFMLDTVSEADDDFDEVSRVNNMAWEFMQVDGLEFDDAVRRAAEIVVSSQVALCEAAFTDVRSLWARLKQASDRSGL